VLQIEEFKQIQNQISWIIAAFFYPTFRINDLDAREFSSHRFLNESMCFNTTACKFKPKYKMRDHEELKIWT
jgi:hypothetical protein